MLHSYFCTFSIHYPCSLVISFFCYPVPLDFNFSTIFSHLYYGQAMAHICNFCIPILSITILQPSLYDASSSKFLCLLSHFFSDTVSFTFYSRLFPVFCFLCHLSTCLLGLQCHYFATRAKSLYVACQFFVSVGDICYVFILNLSSREDTNF